MRTYDTRVDVLIDEVLTAEASDRNQARGGKPWIGVGMEDPIGWTVLCGYDARRYFSDPEFHLAQVLRQKLWFFDRVPDDTRISRHVPAWLGHYPEYTFFGMSLGVQPNGVPLLDTAHPMRSDPDLRHLPPIDFYTSGWMPRMLRWYDDLVELAAGRLDIGFPIWNRGCLDLAIQLRGLEGFLMDTVERPEFVHALMRRLVEERCRWYDARARHLGEKVGPTGVADDWIYVPYISPHIFEEFLLPYYLMIEEHHGGLGSIHSCGNQAPVQQYMLRVKTLNHFEISPWTDPAETVKHVPASKHFYRFVHPNDVLVDKPPAMRAKLRELAAVMNGRDWALGTSGLTPLGSEEEFVGRIETWLTIAREELGR
ncbi:MAG: hypothetical protein HYU66_17625 [Armatimonadetes bacterium]|nr:hypothetical protein [Armatimonadota bacterium]